MIDKRKMEDILINTKIEVGDEDQLFFVLSLLRSKIPYSVCKKVIDYTLEDTLGLLDCDLDKALVFLGDHDILELGRRGVFYDKYTDNLKVFV